MFTIKSKAEILAHDSRLSFRKRVTFKAIALGMDLNLIVPTRHDQAEILKYIHKGGYNAESLSMQEQGGDTGISEGLRVQNIKAETVKG